MKTSSQLATYKTVILLIIVTFLQTITLAQDNTESTTITSAHVVSNSAGNNWYNSPWVWIAGGAFFILLLIALTRDSKTTTSSSTGKGTLTKTASRDTETDVA